MTICDLCPAFKVIEIKVFKHLRNDSWVELEMIPHRPSSLRSWVHPEERMLDSCDTVGLVIVFRFYKM